jgi:glycosidase
MQWDSTAHGGFTTESTTPWMNANPNYIRINAESQVDDPSSTFNYWSSMLATRKKYKDVLVYGNFELIDRDNEKVMVYKRRAETGETMLVLCNFSPDTVEWKEDMGQVKDVVLSNYGRDVAHFGTRKVTLEAYEACALLI